MSSHRGEFGTGPRDPLVKGGLKPSDPLQLDDTVLFLLEESRAQGTDCTCAGGAVGISFFLGSSGYVASSSLIRSLLSRFCI